MRHRRENDASNEDDGKTAVKSVKTREKLTAEGRR